MDKMNFKFSKTKKLISTIALCSLVLVFISCKKNNKFDKYSILTSSSWNVSDIQDNTGNSIMEECQKDDIIKFEKKAFNFTEGENKCSEGMFLRSAEWSFKNDGNTIKIDRVMQTTRGISGGAYSVDYHIITLNDNNLVLKNTGDNNIYYFDR